LRREPTREQAMASAATESVFEIMYTCRSMRRFTSQDVSEATIRELVDAAIRAPSGGNAQGWRFIIVRNPEVKRRLAEEVRKSIAWKVTVDERRIATGRRNGDISGEDEARARRGLAVIEGFGERFEEIPVLVCVCVEPDLSTKAASGSWPSVRRALREYGVLGTLRFAVTGSRLSEQGMWASGYPAVQNLLLAARAKGLGAVLTAPHLLGPPGRFEPILELPKGVKLAAIIPIGHPKGRFGPVRRRPVEEFIFRDRYGASEIEPEHDQHHEKRPDTA
jgi:nitroreductase